MNRADWSLFLGSAINNRSVVAAHALSGLVVIGSTISFTALIALYFGVDIFHLADRIGQVALLRNKDALILSALGASLVLLSARIVQVVIEARVVVTREKWFAEKLRHDVKQVSGNVSRASNYYGRMSSASMKAASMTLLLVISFIAMVVLLPFPYLLGAAGFVLICAVGLFLAMRALSIVMSSSSRGLAENGKKMAAWKQDASVPYEGAVDKYYKSYFNRIFISSIFGLTPAVFSLIFCIIMVLVQEFGFVKFGIREVFLAVVLLQSYVGIMGKFFGSFVQASAFLPAIRACLEGEGVPSKVPQYDGVDGF
ncbi:hypothetical protein CCOS865_01698 [Pseudomonas reidholzensis]|uniref:Uncharacterized protein n=1 Tax=Pseudomonas reidholzensis TaxID=1785162 RepID=A0A383RRD3_9PSED|nr:hypothetical protein [Pseudomonas reidholzensis]SYX89445.1 hypothetical protein CCOS865_01698 [Pseudomonas reidholzensis]